MKVFNNIWSFYSIGAFIRKILPAFMLIYYFNSQAQTAYIPDSSFRNFLITNYPMLMDTMTGELIIVNANSQQGTLDCSNRNIKDLSGIEHFRNIMNINCSNNQIGHIPNLAGYNDFLKKFDCANNRLSVLPSFLPGALGLTYIKCNNNLLYTLQLNNIQNLDTLECHNNYLTFTDLLPLKGVVISHFLYSPQFPAEVAPRVEVEEGGTYNFVYSFDSISFYDHRIFKNNIQAADLLNQNTFTITNVKLSDAGFYSWQVTDSLLPALTLSTTPQELVVVNKNSQIFTPDGDGNNDSYYISCEGNKGIYDKYGKLIKEFQGAVAYWDGTDLQGKPVPTGVYMIRCGDKVESSVTLIR